MHPTQEEAIFVPEGQGFSETEEGKVAIGPGSVVFVPAGIYHATINGSATEPLRAVIIKSPPGEGEVKY